MGSDVDSYLLFDADFCFVNIEVQIWRYSCHVNINIYIMILIGSLRCFKEAKTNGVILDKENLTYAVGTNSIWHTVWNSLIYAIPM